MDWKIAREQREYIILICWIYQESINVYETGIYICSCVNKHYDYSIIRKLIKEILNTEEIND